MNATSVAPQAGTPAGDTTCTQAFSRYLLSLELRRVTETLKALEDCRHRHDELVYWYLARRDELVQELGP